MIKLTTVKNFCVKYGFPDDAYIYFENCFTKLKKSPLSFKRFSELVFLYESDYTLVDFDSVFVRIDELAKICNINAYSLELIYLILLTPHLKEIYKNKGISEEIFDNTVTDLKWKCIECYKVYGVYGIFVAFWSKDIFTLKIFALGRLEFNINTFSNDINKSGFSFKKGDYYIDTHIPSSGRLIHSDCLASYKAAKEFFKDYFQGKQTVFGCYSWLLSPNNYEMLPKNSNIFDFMKDFTVLFEEKKDKNSNIWRIFNTRELPEDLHSLPEDTSLQKSVKEWILKGNTVDEAFGVILDARR